jgi:hypothetical protein
MFVNQIIAVYSKQYFELEQLLELLPESGEDEHPNWSGNQQSWPNGSDYFFWGCWEHEEEFVYVIQISNRAYRRYMANHSRFPLKMRIGMKLKKFTYRGVSCVKQDLILHWVGSRHIGRLGLVELRRCRDIFMGRICYWMQAKGVGGAKWCYNDIPFIKRFES